MATDSILINQTLRRADWRFLAGTPAPAQCLCLASGQLAQATQLISKRATAYRPGLVAECDTAVIDRPNQTTLRQAWQALQAGGVCYSEWHTPTANGLAGITQRLEAAGFTAVSAYWPWPLPDRASPAFWLPLDAPEALHYFLKNRPQPSAPGQRIARLALRTLWQIARRAHLLTPICVVARKPARGGPDQGPTLPDMLQRHWIEWALGRQPSRLSCLWLSGGKSPLNKLVALIFAEGLPFPRLIVKLPRSPESIPALSREADNLQTLHTHLAAAIGIPEILFRGEWAGLPVLGETFIAGQPLYRALRRETYHALALQTTDWLAALAGQAHPSPPQAWWPRLVEPALVDFERHFGVVSSAQQRAATRASLATLPALPQVCEQRDCSPWNVLLTPDNQLAVLDWESAEPQGLPGLDLIYFLTYLAFFVEGVMETGNFRQAYQRLRTPTAFTGQSVLECQQRYIDRLGLAPDVWHPLSLLTWLIHSRSEYKRLEMAAGRPPSPDTLRHSLFFTLWQEQLERGR